MVEKRVIECEVSPNATCYRLNGSNKRMTAGNLLEGFGGKDIIITIEERPLLRGAETCLYAQQERGRWVHCGDCHDINEGYKFLPNWRPRGD
jgi:hypothetical protein